MAQGAAGFAQDGKGVDAPQRRTRTATAGAALGADRQAIPVRHRRWQGFAGGPVPRTLATTRLSLHVRAGLQRGLSLLLDDRRWVQWICRTPGPSRRDAVGHFARTAGEAAGLQAAVALDLPVGIIVRKRFQFR